MSDLVSHLRLARTPGVGPITYKRLLSRYSTPNAALDALPEITARAGRPPPIIPSISSIEAELSAVDRVGAAIVLIGGPDYPPMLADLEDAPPAITILGDRALLSQRAVAIVGARNATLNGRRIAAGLAEAVAESGLAVVSGLARGIDAAAHQGAMRRGRTIAAIAGGIDVAYPPEHAGMQRAIAENGAVVAEQPFGTAPQSRHFPRRNRIISGLSLGVVVVEAALRSGSLITARLAAEAGRDVFAVPGSPLDPRCRGSNDLLRQGAVLTETVADILAHLNAPRLPPVRALRDAGLPWTGPLPSAAEVLMARSRLLELLGPSPSLVDDLIRDCQLPTAGVLAALVDLELAGRLETLPGNRVALLDGPEFA